MKVLAGLLCLAALLACSRAKTASAAPPQAAEQAGQQHPTSQANIPAAPRVNAERAMQYTREIVKFGPRPVGSENHRKVEQYILSHLKNDDIEQDKFTAQTAAGSFPMNNITAKFPGAKDGLIVLASHYDTNYPLRNTSFIGANDGACTSALLLEIGNQLRGKKLDGYSVWLLWTDGEEAMVQWSDTDSLYGTKHLAQKWQQDGTAKKIKAFIVLDMIGDADLDIQRDENSTAWLEDLIYQAASRFGYQSHFYAQAGGVEDDHLPFARIGVPVADIIDIDYGYNNSFHHTTQDTLDKLSPRSLQIVGDTVLQAIQMINQR